MDGVTAMEEVKQFSTRDAARILNDTEARVRNFARIGGVVRSAARKAAIRPWKSHLGAVGRRGSPGLAAIGEANQGSVIPRPARIDLSAGRFCAISSSESARL